MSSDRKVVAISGADAPKFLQDLVSNDIKGAADGLVYAALLTPQGKYLADFFITARPEGGFWLDCDAAQAGALIQRLTLYRLRADVVIEPTDLVVSRGIENAPHGAMADPRHPALGWRMIGDFDQSQADIDWDALRVAHCIPHAGIELIPNDTYILEAGFEALSGVDFRKGCYVGQEVTARMHHKTSLRKGFRTVGLSAPVPLGTEITNSGKTIGQVFTQSGDRAIAYLRFDRLEGELRAGDGEITISDAPAG